MDWGVQAVGPDLAVEMLALAVRQSELLLLQGLPCRLCSMAQLGRQDWPCMSWPRLPPVPRLGGAKGLAVGCILPTPGIVADREPYPLQALHTGLQ